jgi:pimeloyl-ACP methyl ester carboxylesterase
MIAEKDPQVRTKPAWRRWVRIAFLSWALFSSLWLANSVRTQGVEPHLLKSDARVEVVDRSTTLEFLPTAGTSETAMVFICGSGIAAEAYAPLLRPLADEGVPVFVVRLPYRFAPFESHKQQAVDIVRALPKQHPEYTRWVVAGHSLGAALACRVVRTDAGSFDAMVLVGTTHPKQDNLSYLKIPVTKVYGNSDGIATSNDVVANAHLLPAHTRWVEIEGANHSQFGHYGHQLMDRTATISRESQQQQTREVLFATITEINQDPRMSSHAE